jgi:hypothetical protein
LGIAKEHLVGAKPGEVEYGTGERGYNGYQEEGCGEGKQKDL